MLGLVGQADQDVTLDVKLSSTPTSKALRRAITNKLFISNLTEESFDSIGGLEAYFSDWYEEQCEVAADHVSVKTHREVLEIIAHLQSTNLSRSDIFEKLAKPSINDELLHASINLAARLWLGISVGSVQRSLTPWNAVKWDTNKLSCTIHDALWPKSQLVEKVKLPKIFCAVNLERIAGIKVVWTSNLADHLCLRDDDTKIMLFHQASFLELHENTQSGALPKGLVEETTRTLGLLIPSIDKRSKVWFRQKQKSLGLDPKAGSYGPLNASARQIEHFDFWRDRLVILKQTFDDAEPHTLSLWWYDDRKKVQWYTFWVAALVLLLTIVFGVIQSGAAVIQAWASVRSMPRS